MRSRAPDSIREERAAHRRKVAKLHPGNRFRLMAALPLLPEAGQEVKVDRNDQEEARDE